VFRTVPLSIIRNFFHCTHSNTYRFADSLRAGSGWNFLILLASCRQTCMYCCVYSEKTPDDGQRNCPKHVDFFLYFSDRASQYIYLNINQLDALNFIMSLFRSSTCFEHKCSSSGSQNYIIQFLVSSHL